MVVKVKWKELSVVVIAILVLPIQGILSNGRCSHSYPKEKDVIRGVHVDPGHVVRRRSIDQPLRIAVHYDQSVLELEERKRKLINGTIIPEAVRFWEKALMVRKTGNVIRLNRRCLGDRVFYRKRATHCVEACEAVTTCGEVRVPEEHLDVCRTCNEIGRECRESGPDGVAGPTEVEENGQLIGAKGRGVPGADFVLYVSAVETERCSWGSTVAYAAHCQQEAALDRPIAGFANLCPSSLVIDEDKNSEHFLKGKKSRRQHKGAGKRVGESPARDHRLQVSTVKHEILHALGFSVSLFAFFRDDRGVPLTPRSEHGWPPLNEKTQVRIWSDKVVRKIVRNDWLAGLEEGEEGEAKESREEGDDEGEEGEEEGRGGSGEEGGLREGGEREEVDVTTESLGRDERRRKRSLMSSLTTGQAKEEGTSSGRGHNGRSSRNRRRDPRERWHFGSKRMRLKRVRREVHMLVTERVVAEAREHFGCPTLEGAELEDQGGDGTELTHWEKRVFEDEAMTGTQTQEGSFSRLTLALMEDTGWYRANYSVAAPLHWGKGLGCAFATRSCAEWIKERRKRGLSEAPFCTRVKRNPLRTECTRDKDSVALCNLLEFQEPLPPLYQNFDQIDGVEEGREAWFGGSVELADRCPYLQEFVWRSGEQAARSSHCLLEENNPASAFNFALESYGEGSQCIEHGGPWEERTCKVVRQWGHWGAGCYKVTCAAGRLHIEVENRTFTCYYAGQLVAVRMWVDDWLHKGSLICPACNDICQAELELQGDRCKDDANPSDVHIGSQISVQQKRLLDDAKCSAVIPRPSKMPLMVLAVAFLVRSLIQR